MKSRLRSAVKSLSVSSRFFSRCANSSPMKKPIFLLFVLGLMNGCGDTKQGLVVPAPSNATIPTAVAPPEAPKTFALDRAYEQLWVRQRSTPEGITETIFLSIGAKKIALTIKCKPADGKASSELIIVVVESDYTALSNNSFRLEKNHQEEEESFFPFQGSKFTCKAELFSGVYDLALSQDRLVFHYPRESGRSSGFFRIHNEQ